MENYYYSNIKIIIMSKISIKIGYWTSVFLTFSFIIWIISFVGIALTSPLFYWTNMDDFITHIQTNNSRFFQNLAFLFMLLVGPAYLLLINSFYDMVDSVKEKTLVRISLLFGLGYAVTSSINYFAQLSSVRLNIEKGNFEGLEYFIQANPDSILTSIAMLGWTLYLGLSSLFIFSIFKGNRLKKVLKIGFLFNGISCLLAGIGYVFQIDILTFIFINIGSGGALILISVSSVKLFKKQIAERE